MSINRCIHTYVLVRSPLQAQVLAAVDLSSFISPEAFMQSYMSYFATIAGFFIIEDAILKSGNHLISLVEVMKDVDICIYIDMWFYAHLTFISCSFDVYFILTFHAHVQVETLWEKASSKMKLSLQEQFERMSDPMVFLSVGR